MTDTDRELSAKARLSPEQLQAIRVDTHLPGEIAYTYGLTAAVVVRLKRNLGRRRPKRNPD